MARNVVTEQDIALRQVLFKQVFSWLAAMGTRGLINNVYEVGFGQGQNLIAIQQMSKGAIEVYGCEPNLRAYKAAKEALETSSLTLVDKWRGTTTKYDMVFTSGVLIHIATDQLGEFIDNMYNASSKYIVVIEYFSAEEREIPYRGQRNALWTRDYGSIIMDRHSDLRCIGYGFLWKRMTGLDNLTYWIFEKGN